MKKTLFLLALTACVVCTSCATIVYGKASACQKTKPAAGQPARDIRVAPLIADCCLGFVWLAVDFGTGAIYQPCDLPAQGQKK
jgi:hypothetical protein